MTLKSCFSLSKHLFCITCLLIGGWYAAYGQNDTIRPRTYDYVAINEAF
ncbi:MAG: hypothetical protein AAGJ82_04840 [Bacteroidota bacterium]